MSARLSVSLAAATIIALLSGSTDAAACTITAQGVSFGNYDVFTASPTDITGSVTYNCDKRVLQVKLDKGGASTFAGRRMLKSAEPLSYNLYTNATRTTIWGDGTEGTSFFSTTVSEKNVDIVLTIYGRIPAGQDVTAGAYANTVIATLDW